MKAIQRHKHVTSYQSEPTATASVFDNYFPPSLFILDAHFNNSWLTTSLTRINNICRRGKELSKKMETQWMPERAAQSACNGILMLLGTGTWKIQMQGAVLMTHGLVRRNDRFTPHSRNMLLG
jgi:hypothetical protein